MFGTMEHPMIANSLPLTIELLSPADQANQITNDLPRILVGLMGDSPQGVRRSIPEASMAYRSGDGGTETVEGSTPD